ncbi:MAG: PD40 domain-containing protein [Acidobacteriia bacterium]|nr:PD40 domain-containing protein [Terriglobia bacterium]
MRSILTILTLLAIGLTLALRLNRTQAADADRTTWGATDPAWSPDSSKIAFSLYGSIWEVNAQGGEARQLTSSPGYHAHPAWSPDGKHIAFVSGDVPAGRLPNIPGKLAILNLATGAERTIETRFPVAGSPTWSASGASVIAGLTPVQGSLLHEIPINGGAPRQIQFQMQRGPAGPWAPSSRAGDTIFLANTRNGPIQIWSLPAAGRPIFVQMPLTRYTPGDIFQITGLSALPDASGVIYSGAHVNGKGDHELYFVPAKGGPPRSITNTTRDEFSPAVSPDGRTVAHVSNHLGNIDIFTMPVTEGNSATWPSLPSSSATPQATSAFASTTKPGNQPEPGST